MEYATVKQKIILQAVIDCDGNVARASRQVGYTDESAVRHMIKRVQHQAEKLQYMYHNDSKPSYKSNILIIDIETSPTKAYVWKMWKENIGHSQVIDGSYIMCFCAKWLGEEDVTYAETRDEDDSTITKLMVKLLDKADIVIAHNADRFDIPRINASAIKHGINPPSPYKVIDTLKVAKRHFKFERNTLAHIAEFLGCSAKLKHEKFNGFELWRECLAGNDEAWEEMMTYNIQDVHTLEEVYTKLRPWIKEHPNVAIQQEADAPLCSKCGSQNILMNGFTHTDISKFRLYRCVDCGGFSRSRSTEYPKIIRKDLLTTVR
jgi:uncharacterized protein YprB with RNaseH-like and TPR domain/DNA-directed RNA polymerase subunit RPC12/RpoP